MGFLLKKLCWGILLLVVEHVYSHENRSLIPHDFHDELNIENNWAQLRSTTKLNPLKSIYHKIAAVVRSVYGFVRKTGRFIGNERDKWASVKMANKVFTWHVYNALQFEGTTNTKLILFMRHGTTDYNQWRRHTFTRLKLKRLFQRYKVINPPLNDKGIKESNRLAKLLGMINDSINKSIFGYNKIIEEKQPEQMVDKFCFEINLVSPLERAITTAAIAFDHDLFACKKNPIPEADVPDAPEDNPNTQYINPGNPYINPEDINPESLDGDNGEIDQQNPYQAHPDAASLDNGANADGADSVQNEDLAETSFLHVKAPTPGQQRSIRRVCWLVWEMLRERISTMADVTPGRIEDISTACIEHKQNYLFTHFCIMYNGVTGVNGGPNRGELDFFWHPPKNQLDRYIEAVDLTPEQTNEVFNPYYYSTDVAVDSDYTDELHKDNIMLMKKYMEWAAGVSSIGSRPLDPKHFIAENKYFFKLRSDLIRRYLCQMDFKTAAIVSHSKLLQSLVGGSSFGNGEFRIFTLNCNTRTFKRL